MPGGVQAYPRIANLFAYSSSGQAPAFSRYGLIVAGPSTASSGALQSLKVQSPATKALVYYESTSVDVPGFDGLTIYPGWWLTLAGTTLTAPLDTSSTSVSVANGSIIANYLSSNPDILVDGESMHVTAVSGNTLTVQRGYNSTATSHATGARLAAHATGWPGSWMLNITPYCPTDSAGNTWESYLATTAAAQLSSGPWDGIFFDSVGSSGWAFLDDGQLDANNDNVADGGEGPSGTGWATGETSLFSNTRARIGSAILVGNGDNYPGASSGEELEAFPGRQGGAVAGLALYQSLAGPSSSEPYTIANPDTGNTGTQDLQTMRFNLGIALMGNGYYAYDYGDQMHGQTWWYDEYDDGAGSSLPAAISASPSTLTVAAGTGSKFAVGNVVQVPDGTTGWDDEQMLVTAVSGDTLTVQRGYNGTTAATHLALSKVMTQAQISAGQGWLGQPLGAATTLATNFLRRDFTNGTVLLNATSSAQNVSLGASFHRIAGTQDSSTNSGAAATSVTIPAQDALLLVRNAQ